MASVVHKDFDDVPQAGMFDIHEGDILQISVTVNVCLLLQAIFNGTLGCMLSQRGCRRFGPLSATIQGQHCLLGKLIMELSVLLVILFLTIQESFNTDIRPFTRDDSISPGSLLRLVYCIIVGRFLVIAGNMISSGHGQDDNVTHSLSGQTGKPGLDFVYYVISIISNVVSLGYGENKLLVLTSSFMELNCIQVACRRLFVGHMRSSLKITLLCSIVFIISRLILPIIFLGLAVSKESPLLMSTVPLIWFNFSCLFYGILHIFLLYHCIRELLGVLSNSIAPLMTARPPSPASERGNSDNAGHLSIYRPPFAIPIPCQTYWPNNLHPGSDSVKSVDCELSPKDDTTTNTWTVILKQLNLGILRCYDNRNVCNSRVSRPDDKMNIGLKKTTAKERLLSQSGSVGQSADKVRLVPKQEIAHNQDESGRLLNDRCIERLDNCCEDNIDDCRLHRCDEECQIPSITNEKEDAEEEEMEEEFIGRKRRNDMYPLL